MKLTNDDYLSYKTQVLNEILKSQMNIEAQEQLLKWLETKIKKQKKPFFKK